MDIHEMFLHSRAIVTLNEFEHPSIQESLLIEPKALQAAPWMDTDWFNSFWFNFIPWTKVYLVSESEHWQIISSLTGLNESKKCFWAYNGKMIGYLEKYHWKKLFTWKHFLGLELKKDRMKKSLKLRINGHIDSTFIKQKNCTVMMETSFHFVCLSAKG